MPAPENGPVWLIWSSLLKEWLHIVPSFVKRNISDGTFYKTWLDICLPRRFMYLLKYAPLNTRHWMYFRCYHVNKGWIGSRLYLSRILIQWSLADNCTHRSQIPWVCLGEEHSFHFYIGNQPSLLLYLKLQRLDMNQWLSAKNVCWNRWRHSIAKRFDELQLRLSFLVKRQ